MTYKLWIACLYWKFWKSSCFQSRGSGSVYCTKSIYFSSELQLFVSPMQAYWKLQYLRDNSAVIEKKYSFQHFLYLLLNKCKQYLWNYTSTCEQQLINNPYKMYSVHGFSFLLSHCSSPYNYIRHTSKHSLTILYWKKN